MPSRVSTRRSASSVLSGLILALTVGSATAAGRELDTVGTLAAPSVDLAAGLDASGSFRGTPGLSGNVDLARWTLVSDLRAGETPRFADARRRTIRPAGSGGWSAVGSGPLNHAVFALRSKRSELYLGGAFFSPPGAPNADGIAAWDGAAYSAFGPNNSIPSDVNAIAVDGEDLYVGGVFTNPSFDGTADYIAKWDGSQGQWESIGGGLNGPVRAIAISGSDIYIGGDFVNADGDNRIDHVARYDGSWHRLGEHGGDGSLEAHVDAIAISGSDVYVGGLFTNADGNSKADYVARWDGAWHELGHIGTEGALGAEVYALLVSGRDLYVGGSFHNAKGIADADLLARWRGGSWSAVGTNFAGSDGGDQERVYALAKAGPDLFVGGHFTDAADIDEADRVARFDGTDWYALGETAPGDGAIDDTVYALAAFDGLLYVGGEFEDAAGNSDADYLAAWALPVSYLPDGRVRRGTSDPFTGNDIYNGGGKHQKVTADAPRGSTITYQISIQNDSPTTLDSYRIAISGTATSDYTVKVLRGSTDITTDVVNGTFHTAVTNAGSDTRIKVRIKVKHSAPAGSQVTRTITLTSDSDDAVTQVDAVKIVARRS